MASAGGGLKKIIPFILGGIVLLLIGVGAFLFLRSRNSTPSGTGDQTGNTGDLSGNQANSGQTGNKQVSTGQQTTLDYWGLWEADDTLKSVFADFESAHPGVIIQYTQQSHLDYRQRLQSAIASGNGPDIFRYHASWVPMLTEELATLPSNVMSKSEYENTFYPVAAKQLQVKGQYVGIPLMYDGLALFYNKSVLATAGVQPPQTWAELKNLASELTIRDESGNIRRAGLAIGNTSNTEHFADILELLLLQNGADPADPTSQKAQEALVFYTNFVTKDKVWDDTLPSSTVAFARGDVAMMFAPSWRVHEILAMSPDLDFGVVPLPTLGGNRLAVASYWAEGVSNRSKNAQLAWEFLKYLSSADVMQKLYNNQSQTRAFGEIYSRMDLASSLANTPYVSAILSDAPYADAWYLNSYTHDNGLNDNLIKYYKDAINALDSGKQLINIMDPLSLGVTQTLRQYGLATAPQPTATPKIQNRTSK